MWEGGHLPRAVSWHPQMNRLSPGTHKSKGSQLAQQQQKTTKDNNKRQQQQQQQQQQQKTTTKDNNKRQQQKTTTLFSHYSKNLPRVSPIVTTLIL